MLLSKLAGDYVRLLPSARKGFSEKTAESYDLSFRQFIGWLMSQGQSDDVRSFTGDHVDGFASYLAEQGLKTNSICIKLSALSSLAKWAMTQKDGKGKYLLDENPVSRIERPRKTRPDRKFLHADELSRFLSLDAATGWTANELLARDLFIDTGLRASELVRTNVADLWQDSAGRTVLSTTVKGAGRAEQKVHIPLGASVAERLKDALLARGIPAGHESLLVNRAGHRYNRTTVSELLARMARKAGIDRMPVRAHALRHTYNVLARQAKLDVATRAALLNHTDQNTIQRYDHLLPDETFAARDAVRAKLAEVRVQRA